VLAWHAGVLWLALLSEENDAGAMLDRMIQQLGDSRDADFVKAIRQQKELNLGKAMHVLSGRPGGNAARDQANALRLAAVHMPEHAASDPAVLRVLVLFYRTYFVLRFDAAEEPPLDEYIKFLRQTKTASALEPLRSELIELRSKVVGWIETAAHANVMKKFNKDGTMEAAFNARGDAIDKALKARDVQAVKQNLRAAVPEFRRLLDSARAAAAEEIGQLRKDAGPLTARLFELSLAIQQEMMREGKPPFEEVVEELPELKTTAEWKEFQAIVSESPGRLWIQREARLVWKDVLANVTNGIDAEVVLQVLQEWERRASFQGGKRQDFDFETMRKELKQRIVERRFASKEPPAPTDPDLPQRAETDFGSSPNQPASRRFSTAALLGLSAAGVVALLLVLRNRRTRSTR
jgi:hypothetical protein